MCLLKRQQRKTGFETPKDNGEISTQICKQ